MNVSKTDPIWDESEILVGRVERLENEIPEIDQGLKQLLERVEVLEAKMRDRDVGKHKQMQLLDTIVETVEELRTLLDAAPAAGVDS